jgi:hypothetical protein
MQAYDYVNSAYTTGSSGMCIRTMYMYVVSMYT